MTQLTLDGRTDTAQFSTCGTYRYELTRQLGGDRPLLICGLNPSVATASKNDPTIRKEIGFAKLWGCGRLVKVNAYGFIATDPKVMKAARKRGVDVVGPHNDAIIRRAVDEAVAQNGIILVAWGRNIETTRQAEISYVFGDYAKCLGVNEGGSPEHPLYVPYTRELQYWSCP